MALHLLRTGVGIDSVRHIRERQRHYAIFLNDNSDERVGFIHTRFQPKKSNDILKTNGSVYWIIKGYIQCRQRIVGFEEDTEDDGKKFCRILLDPEVIRTESRRHRHIQGWRYLKENDAPKDMDTGIDDGIEDMPEHMIKELQKLGLI